MRTRRRNTDFDQAGFSQDQILLLYLAVGDRLRRVRGQAFYAGTEYTLSEIYNNQMLGKLYTTSLASLDDSEIEEEPFEFEEVPEPEVLFYEETEKEEPFSVSVELEDDEQSMRDQFLPRGFAEGLRVDDEILYRSLEKGEVALLLEQISEGALVDDDQAGVVFANALGLLQSEDEDNPLPEGEERLSRVRGVVLRGARSSAEEARKAAARYILNQISWEELEDVGEALDEAQIEAEELAEDLGREPIYPGDIEVESFESIAGALASSLRGLGNDASIEDGEDGQLYLYAPKLLGNQDVTFRIILANVKCPEVLRAGIPGARIDPKRTPVFWLFVRRGDSQEVMPVTGRGTLVRWGDYLEECGVEGADGDSVEFFGNVEELADGINHWTSSMKRRSNPSVPIASAFVVTSGIAFGSSLLELIRALRS